MFTFWKWPWWIWFLIAAPPVELILVDGYRLPLRSPPKLAWPLVHLALRDGPEMSLRASRVDWKRSLAPKPKPKRKPLREKRDLSRIPWEHPAFADKQTIHRDIHITGDMVERYGKAHRPPSQTGSSSKKKPRKKESEEP